MGAAFVLVIFRPGFRAQFTITGILLGFISLETVRWRYAESNVLSARMLQIGWFCGFHEIRASVFYFHKLAIFNQVLQKMGARPLRTVVSSKLGKHDSCSHLGKWEGFK